jgi:hypothetical protein
VIEFLPRLNQRHKAALFLTLLAAGASLVLNMAAKQTTGVVLLGLAFAWAFGSNSRAVHVLFIAAGVLLILIPMGFVYPPSSAYREAVEEQGSEAWAAASGALSDPSKCAAPPAGLLLTREELERAVKDTSHEGLVCHKRTVEGMTAHSMAGSPNFIPSSELPAGFTLDVTLDNFLLENPAWKPALVERHKPPFPRVIAHWVGPSLAMSAPGFLLVCVGLGLIFWVKRQRQPS